jgi:DNA sulfur modification protein DndB
MPTITTSDTRITGVVATSPLRRTGEFEYVLPALRGVQAGHEYYVTMCPLRLIPQLFVFDAEDLSPELRAQRALNRARVPEITRYITQNPTSYVFSALTASVDADARFECWGNAGPGSRIGTLTIPMSARCLVNDGQHRRAAIERALAERPELGDETIAIVLFIDAGLERCQQMFADLNRYAIRPARSISVLYDHRDEVAVITKLVAHRIPLLGDLTDIEGTNLSARSRKLFTLSAFHTANRALLENLCDLSFERRADVVAEFWAAVIPQFREWGQVHAGAVPAGEIRRDFIHSHGIVLHALGRVGSALVGSRPDVGESGWELSLRMLAVVDWRRGNTAMWEGRAVIGGRVCKSSVNVLLTTAAIRSVLGLPLSDAEQRAEDEFQGGKR